MADDLVLYTHPMSRGRIARWMLEELGQPYRAELLDYDNAMRTPDFLALNPIGKVPVLKHGDTVVTETAAICAYLADAFPDSGLAPAPTDKLRGPYLRWLFFAAGPMEAAITNRALKVELTPEARKWVGYASFNDVMDVLEGAVSGGSPLVGGRFSAADIYVGSQIHFGLRFGSIEARPAFQKYWDAVGQRPAAVRAREIDDALLKH